MSKADKMFSKLGFYKILENEEKYSNKNKLSVEFKNKEVRVFSLYGFDVFVMDIEFSLAINEKMKELGWLEEEYLK